MYFIAAILAEHALLTKADEEWMWNYGAVHVHLILESNQEVELETTKVGAWTGGAHCLFPIEVGVGRRRLRCGH